MLKNRRITDARGSTLIELLVAIGLFGTLIAIAMGGFVQALRTQRQTTVLLATNSVMSLVIEQLNREVRTGTGFSTDALRGKLMYTNARGERVEYCLDARNAGAGYISRRLSDTDPSGCGTVDTQRLTTDVVNIREMYFTVFDGGALPPRVTLHIAVSPRGEPLLNSVMYRIQTTISARNF